MDRLLERLRRGEGPPLRMSEFATVMGYDYATLRKLVNEGVVESVTLPGMSERRIPIQEAAKHAIAAKVLKGA